MRPLLCVAALAALCSATPRVSAAASQDPEVAYIAGLEGLAEGRLADALAALDQAVSGEPERATYRVARGAARLFAEDPERAIEDLERARKLEPERAEARLWRAAADRMRADFFTQVYPQSTRDPFESRVGDVSAHWGQTFRAVEQGYEPAPEVQAAARAALADLARWFAERELATGAGLQARWRGARARCDAGDWVGAGAAVAAARRAWPEDQDVLFYDAGCRLARGDALGARATYTRVLSARTDLAPAYLGRALAAARLGDRARAEADTAVAAALAPGTSVDARRAEVERELRAALSVRDPALRVHLDTSARRVRTDEAYQDGLRAREDALRGAPADPARMAELASFLYDSASVRRERVEPRGAPRLFRCQTEDGQRAELARAESLCDQALALDPRSTRALVTKAAVRMWNLQFGDAETLLARALELAPDDAGVLDLLSQVLDVAAAQKRALAASLRTPAVVGSNTRIEGDYEVTTTWWRYPSQDELDRADALEREAERCLALAEARLARAAQALAGTPQGAFYRGQLERRAGRLDEARAAFEQATRLDARYVAAWFQLAGVLADQGRGAEALEARAAGLDLVETSAAPWLAAAWREIERTAFQSALTLLAKGEERDPADARCALYRAIALRGLERLEDAERELERALALEQARATLAGTSLAPSATRPFATELVGATLAARERLAGLRARTGRMREALDVYASTLALEPRLARGQDTDEVAGALVPDFRGAPDSVPVAEPLLVHVARARVGAGNALLELGELAAARDVLGPVLAYGATRINGYQSDRLRESELYARAALCRIALAAGDLEQAKLHASGLPRMRHGVGPSLGAFPELERIGQELQDEVARLEQEARERGDERSDEYYPPDFDAVAELVARVAAESGLAAFAQEGSGAQNVSAPLTAALRQVVQLIATPKSNRWREEVRFGLQLLASERDDVAGRARNLSQPSDPRFARARDADLYARLAACAERVVERTQALAIERGYPPEELARDLATRSGVPGPAPFTGGANDPDRRYAELCARLGLPYLRRTDRAGASPENMLSLGLRGALEAIDAPLVPTWREGVVRGLAQLARAREEFRRAALDASRRADDLRARARAQPKNAGALGAQIRELEAQQSASERVLALADAAVAALSEEATKRGYPAADLARDLARVGLAPR